MRQYLPICGWEKWSVFAFRHNSTQIFPSYTSVLADLSQRDLPKGYIALKCPLYQPYHKGEVLDREVLLLPIPIPVSKIFCFLSHLHHEKSMCITLSWLLGHHNEELYYLKIQKRQAKKDTNLCKIIYMHKCIFRKCYYELHSNTVLRDTVICISLQYATQMLTVGEKLQCSCCFALVMVLNFELDMDGIFFK